MILAPRKLVVSFQKLSGVLITNSIFPSNPFDIYIIILSMCKSYNYSYKKKSRANKHLNQHY